MVSVMLNSKADSTAPLQNSLLLMLHLNRALFIKKIKGERGREINDPPELQRLSLPPRFPADRVPFTLGIVQDEVSPAPINND